MHEDNMFLTLTYAPENLPRTGSLVPKHYTDFMKRYRKSLSPKKIRFFHVGEYGEKTLRPHYHALIFGHRFRDLKLLKTTPAGHHLYTSETLDDLWSHGQCFIGELTPDSAGYVARYVMKKVMGSDEYADQALTRVDPNTGEIHKVIPEYATMSRRPGIGRTWFDLYSSDVFPDDKVIINGRPKPVPRYYSALFKEREEKLARSIKIKRARKAKKFAKTDGTYHRLVAREKCKKAQLSTLKRELE